MKITEKTTVPLFAVFGSIPIVVGGIFWLTAISFKGDLAVAENIKQDKILQDQSQTLKEQLQMLQNVEKVVIRIEERLRRSTANENK